MSVPWKRTTPAEGTSRRLPSRSSVDLPAPEGPASTVTRPGQTVTSTPRRSTAPSSEVTCTASKPSTVSGGGNGAGATASA